MITYSGTPLASEPPVRLQPLMARLFNQLLTPCSLNQVPSFLTDYRDYLRISLKSKILTPNPLPCVWQALVKCLAHTTLRLIRCRGKYRDDYARVNVRLQCNGGTRVPHNTKSPCVGLSESTAKPPTDLSNISAQNYHTLGINSTKSLTFSF
jgi:hypothetical protein